MEVFNITICCLLPFWSKLTTWSCDIRPC